MYQLSHLLTDQKSIMTSMMELSLTGDKGTRFIESLEIRSYLIAELVYTILAVACEKPLTNSMYQIFPGVS